MKTQQQIIQELAKELGSVSVKDTMKYADEMAEEYLEKIEKECERKLANIKLRLDDLAKGIRRAYASGSGGNPGHVIGKLAPEDYEERAKVILTIHKTYVRNMAMAIRLRSALKVLALAEEKRS